MDILYFQKTERGLVSVLSNGKIVFAHRSSGLTDSGLVDVTNYIDKGGYEFAFGKYIKVQSMEKEDIIKVMVNHSSSLSISNYDRAKVISINLINYIITPNGNDELYLFYKYNDLINVTCKAGKTR